MMGRRPVAGDVNAGSRPVNRAPDQSIKTAVDSHALHMMTRKRLLPAVQGYGGKSPSAKWGGATLRQGVDQINFTQSFVDAARTPTSESVKQIGTGARRHSLPWPRVLSSIEADAS